MHVLVGVPVIGAVDQIFECISRTDSGDQHREPFVCYRVVEAPGAVGDDEGIRRRPGCDPLALGVRGVFRQLHAGEVFAVGAALLEENQGQKSEVATRLDMPEEILDRKLDDLGIENQDSE
ncbi:MAG TPA: hypothetical protein EYO84_10100 [Planctomycetes bacterium]|nr:hypothetical protein [Planctomycetota bacterium]